MATNNFFEQAGGGRSNPLDLTQGEWKIDGVPVTASADQLNTSSIELKGSIAVTIARAFTVPQDATLTYEKIGDICFIELSTPMVLTTDQVGFLSITTIPAFLCANFKNSIALLRIGTTYTQCAVIIRPDGEILIFSDLQQATFPNPTTFEFSPFAFSYRALDLG